MGLRNRGQFADYKCFFVTTTCKDHLHLFKNEFYFNVLYDSLKFVNEKYKAEIVAYVFMPNHIHLILFFEKENRLSDYMRDFKKYTSTRIRQLIEIENRDEILTAIRYKHRKQKFKIWEDRFDDLHLYTQKVLLIKLNYIHNNPVEKGWVKNSFDYKHSSACFYHIEKKAPLPILHFGEIT